MNVEVIRKSCFDFCRHIESIFFESGSQLREIGQAAFRGCGLLAGIAIPASVERIEEAAFKACMELQYCLFDENAVLVRIGRNAFAGCLSLKSFDVPRGVQTIGDNCFRKCTLLRRLRFQSDESWTKCFGGVTLDEAKERLGFTAFSSGFEIKVDFQVN
jgi:hypothetical protein